MTVPLRPVHRGPAVAVAVCAALALGAPTASATPIVEHAPGHVSGRRPDLPAARKIQRVETTFDPATGAWSTTVTFGAPQSAATAGGLRATLSPVDQRSTGSGWRARTDPDAPAVTYGLDPAAAAVPVTSGFNADRTAFTLSVVDPALVGQDEASVHVWITDAEDNLELGYAQAFLGEKAPRARIPRSADRLVATHKGTIRVPLSPLPRAASQRVLIYLKPGFIVAVKSLPATAYRRRVATMRIPAERLRHVGTKARRATLIVETRVESGSVVIAKRRITIRRR